MGSSSPLAGRRVLLGVTGGIAAYKACVLTRLLTQAGAAVQVVMTPSATRFVGTDTFAALSGRPTYTEVWEEPGSVLHVRLARGADVAVVAPATANVIAKLSGGIADDLLTSTLLEATCPLVVAPAMHSGMWEHPATQANVRALEERGTVVVGPASGPLAAGDEGVGRMAEPEDILAAVEEAASRGRDLAGRRIVVTAGPTWEPIDPVRFVGNRSTGRMGFAVAREAFARGADVTLVVGPGTVQPPEGPRLVEVGTAEEMRMAVLEAADDADAVVMAAAVADFRPREAAPSKLKKEGGPPGLELVPTPDILAELGEVKGDRILVGFAAETEEVEEAGRTKLVAKRLDLLVANEVGREGTGFGSEENHAAILSKAGDDEPLREWTKAELAAAICDRLSKMLSR
ncbi:MAG: bifunctional phosphopantothenoylcysteine decarboxylase/phosphopantothenate--cysteine ligase CoaBC [Actinobacteria bacterium]|nr:MAG: bifunctional phosphopantothenoylcysteine decarboxylase/phosphopantothenate--cysteine ligase CoaBC [Actinomycetota bacterium]TMK47515.1 MAG: bifunctional phosphopantothenoylcysteine decarboxylase/phosphopantothenate--cysteine ligase CoaBC [Actinomycetota bacterium]